MRDREIERDSDRLAKLFFTGVIVRSDQVEGGGIRRMVSIV